MFSKYCKTSPFFIKCASDPTLHKLNAFICSNTVIKTVACTLGGCTWNMTKRIALYFLVNKLRDWISYGHKINRCTISLGADSDTRVPNGPTDSQVNLGFHWWVGPQVCPCSALVNFQQCLMLFVMTYFHEWLTQPINNNKIEPNAIFNYNFMYCRAMTASKKLNIF